MNYEEKQTLLSAAIKAVDYIADCNNSKVQPENSALQLLSSFDEELPAHGKDTLQTIEFLHRHGSAAAIQGGSEGTFGFDRSRIAALAASWLSSTWNQNGQGIGALEKVSGRWITELLPVAKGSSVGFVTGTTMANFCGLAAARSSILTRLGWDAERRGLFGAPEIKVVISEEAHVSVLKALSMLGLGTDRVIRVPTDRNGCMRVDKLPVMDARTIVCLQAGNVNTGGMDSGQVIVEAKKYGAWVHIDGAFGLWAGISSRKRHLTRYYEFADSWATGGSPLAKSPTDVALIICRDRHHLRNAMTLNENQVAVMDKSLYPYTPEFSTGALAVDVWAVLRTLGKSGIDDLVSRTCLYAELLAHRLEHAGFEIMNEVETNLLLVSFGSDEETKAVIQGVEEGGNSVVNEIIWNNRLAMRISIPAGRTVEADITRSAIAMINIARQVLLKAA